MNHSDPPNKTPETPTDHATETDKGMTAWKVVPTVFPTSPPIGETLESFWSCGPSFAQVETDVAPPERPLALLERLGPSPFQRGGFPVIGFLATTYEKVSRYALERD